MAKFASVGDLHFGSAYCQKKSIKEFFGTCRAEGVSRILQVGDFVEGTYRHHSPSDLEAYGIDAQLSIAKDVCEGTKNISFITGNHDHTFSKMGHDVGKYIQSQIKGSKFLGDRIGFQNVGGVKVCLFHPGFGSDKASGFGLSATRLAPMSQLEKFLCGVKDRESPDIVLIGHWHQASFFNYRGMSVILSGTFQGPGGNFSNSLATGPAVGSWIVDFKKKKSGKVEVSPTWIGF